MRSDSCIDIGFSWLQFSSNNSLLISETQTIKYLQKTEGGIYAHVKKVGNNTEKVNTVILEKSLENLSPRHISGGKVLFYLLAKVTRYDGY